MTDIRRKQLRRVRDMERYYRNQGFVFPEINWADLSTQKLKTITGRKMKARAIGFQLMGLSPSDRYVIPIDEWREAERLRARSDMLAARTGQPKEAKVKSLVPGSLDRFRDYVEGVRKRATPGYREGRDKVWIRNYLRQYEMFKGGNKELEYIYENLKKLGNKRILAALRKIQSGNSDLSPLTYIDSNQNFLTENIAKIYKVFGIEPYDDYLERKMAEAEREGRELDRADLDWANDDWRVLNDDEGYPY